MQTHVFSFSERHLLIRTVLPLFLLLFVPHFLSAQFGADGITVAGGNGGGSGANQFSNPIGIAIDGQGNLYITDYFNYRVQKWAPGASEGVTVAGGNGAGSAANQLYSPTGIAVDDQGNVYIADSYNNRVQKWAPDASEGITVAGGNGDGSAVNQLSYPSGIAIDGQGNLYIADQFNHRVQKWAPGAVEGTTVAGGNGKGNGLNQLDYPCNVSIDGEGNLYIADTGNVRIQKWVHGASEGTTAAGGNGRGYGADQFYNIYGLAVDSQNNIYIADFQIDRVQKWASGASEGTTAAGGNGTGSGANQLSGPNGIAIDGQGNLFVADYGNNRIQKFTPNVLPVTLVNFNARKNESNHVLLEWVTTFETNSESFDVEHSVNGKNWEVIASIASRQDSKELSRYSYTHTTPSNGANLYRLKMIDRAVNHKDQPFAYSRMVSMSIEGVTQLILYPNPAINTITIDDSLLQDKIREVKIYDMIGRVVYNSGKMVEGQIDISNYSAGRYLLLVENSQGKINSIRFIKK